MDPEKINEMFKKTLDLEIRKKEFTLEGWYLQKDEYVNEELLRCAKNHPEDIPFFKMSFMGDISQKLEDDFKGFPKYFPFNFFFNFFCLIFFLMFFFFMKDYF